MRVAGTAAALLAALLIAGCAGERQPGPPVPLKSFALHDVQGLFGGHAIWAAEDRTAFVARCVRKAFVVQLSHPRYSRA